jgi:hypothetical protein
MIRIGEMAKMRYLRLLLELTGLRKNWNTMRQCISCSKTSRKVLYNILIEFRIPMKLVRLIKMCLNETYNRVRQTRRA